MRNRKVILTKRPINNTIATDNFKLIEETIPDLLEGQILVKNYYLSIDPYMRGRVNENAGYADSQQINEVMIGGTVGEIIQSNNSNWKRGEYIAGLLGWQEYSISKAEQLQKINDDIPLSYYLGAAGLTGVTAWYGIQKICKPQKGQTVVISAAGGAVGSIAGQLAKLAGCTVIGIAGSMEKCNMVINEFNFDACVNYHLDDFQEQLSQHCPNGIDIYFDNVGGDILDSVLLQMNTFGKVCICGMIARHQQDPLILKNSEAILLSRLSITGYVISDHLECWETALESLIPLIKKKEIVVKETIYHGIKHAPQGLIDILQGHNKGKLIVKL